MLSQGDISHKLPGELGSSEEGIAQQDQGKEQAASYDEVISSNYKQCYAQAFVCPARTPSSFMCAFQGRPWRIACDKGD